MRIKKRVFLELMIFSVLLFSLFSWVFWRLSYYGFREIHPLFPHLIGTIFLLLPALSVLAILLLAASLIWGKNPFFKGRVSHVVLWIFSPIARLVGRLLGISKDQMERSFIEVNNALVKARRKQYSFENLLLLMPHCLQDSSCPVRITHEVKNCRSCGRCNVHELLAIEEAYGARIRIASGGTSARRFLLEFKPEAVIAVACERDLASGIRDSFPLPVIGILNERPYGYCFNTRIELSLVREAIELLTGKEEKG